LLLIPTLLEKVPDFAKVEFVGVSEAVKGLDDGIGEYETEDWLVDIVG
jgi:hypothetical protein